MRRNGRRLLKLVNTLLDFSRIQAGRHDARYEPTDVGAVTASLAGVFRATIEQAGLRLEVRSPVGLAPVHVDRAMWEKIVLNLLSNAFKFTFEGTIAVELTDRGSSVEVTVRDTGIGIAPEQLERVFERFHRIENVRARTHEGSGIGLALVQELVRLHGGSVRVESTPGRGSAFTVTLPRGVAHLPADRIAATSSGAGPGGVGDLFLEEALGWLPEAEPRLADNTGAPRAGDPPATSERILVADDNADMREYVTRLLRSRWEVEAVADGGAALVALRARPPALVVTDIMMPGLDGFGLLRAVREAPRSAIPRWSCSPPGPGRSRASRASRRAPTTTSSSPSPPANCWRGSSPRSACGICASRPRPSGAPC